MTVAAALCAAQLPLVVVNPAQVRHYAQALGRHAKTDAIDAEVIARFAEATRPQARPCLMKRPRRSPTWLRVGGRSLP